MIVGYDLVLNNRMIEIEQELTLLLRHFVLDLFRMAENVSQSTDQYVQLEQMITELRNTISQQGQMIANF